jgi:hypothetical protein
MTVNAAFLLMSTAALTGADATPPAAHAPVVISSGAGCSNCGTPAVSYAHTGCGCAPAKVGLLDKLKAKFGKKSHDCGCAPAPAVVHHAPCHTCPTTIAARPNLLDKLKARMSSKKAAACGPVCDPCGAAHLAPATPVEHPPVTGTPPKEMPKETPKEMPKPKDLPKDLPKDAPKAGAVPPPVTGAGGLTGAGSPY